MFCNTGLDIESTFRTLEMIIIERVTRIYIFFIFGYVKNLDQKGGAVNGYRGQMGWGLSYNS